MLLGQDFRGRHESALNAVARREKQRETGDHRLAASDVALKQARHRPARLEIRRNFGDGPTLDARQRERKSVASEAARGLVRGEHDSPALSESLPLGLD